MGRLAIVAVIWVVGASGCMYFDRVVQYRAVESPLSSHCSNGTLDEDETGVDCGGSCASCDDHCLYLAVAALEARDAGVSETPLAVAAHRGVLAAA